MRLVKLCYAIEYQLPICEHFDQHSRINVYFVNFI